MGTIWDGGWPEIPELEREAMATWQPEEPDEIDLAPGTEAPPGTTVPHERSMRAIIASRNAAQKLWDLIQNSVRDARRMISLGLRLACLFCLALASQACRPEPGRTAGMQGEVHCVKGHPHIEPPVPYDSLGAYALEPMDLEPEENARHEAEHYVQFLANCDSIAAIWESDPVFRLYLESQATCRAIKETWPTDSLRRYRKGLAAARISQTYLASKGNTLGIEDVYDALDIWCGG